MPVRLLAVLVVSFQLIPEGEMPKWDVNKLPGPSLDIPIKTDSGA